MKNIYVLIYFNILPLHNDPLCTPVISGVTCVMHTLHGFHFPIMCPWDARIHFKATLYAAVLIFLRGSDRESPSSCHASRYHIIASALLPHPCFPSACTWRAAVNGHKLVSNNKQLWDIRRPVIHCAERTSQYYTFQRSHF